MTEKVIEFPKHKVVRDIPGDVIEERNRRADQKMADNIVTEVSAMIISELDNFLINVEDESFTKDLVLLVEALRATVYRQVGFEHYLHPYIEKNINIISKKDAEAIENMTEEQIQKMILEMVKMKELDKDNDK
jgi:hypothetical protein